MLRAVLLGIGVLLLGISVVAALAGYAASLVVVPAFSGAALLAGILFERRRYKPPAPNLPGADWVFSGERFVDPSSGERVSVYHRPATGERRYVTESTSVRH
jgi:hypothetical protein